MATVIELDIVNPEYTYIHSVVKCCFLLFDS